ncbi:hypothetical protein MYX75_02705 [Acidobacteria bacterium AH-259-A15]|nr:hypothetical protein [Acidobacteria bacterium AH-259-A15]
MFYDSVLNEHGVTLENFVHTEEVEAAERKFYKAYKRIEEMVSNLPEEAEREVIKQLNEMESGLISSKALALEEMFNLFVGLARSRALSCPRPGARSGIPLRLRPIRSVSLPPLKWALER